MHGDYDCTSPRTHTQQPLYALIGGDSVWALVLLLMCVWQHHFWMTGCEADCHWLKLWTCWFRSTVRVGGRTQSQLDPLIENQKSLLLFLFIPSLFLYLTILLFNYFMEQQSLPTCMNHTGDGLSGLAAQIAHLLQFTDVLVKAVPDIWSDSLSALH